MIEGVFIFLLGVAGGVALRHFLWPEKDLYKDYRNDKGRLSARAARKG